MDRTSHGNREASRHRAVAAALVAALWASVGCTICPDPFDYSGPVPDGSPPQNDFRARAGGILPVGAAPRPWPPIVKGVGRPDEMPVIADEEPEVVIAEDRAAELRQTSVLVPEPADAENGEVDVLEETSVPGESPVELLSVPAAAPPEGPPIADPENTGTVPAPAAGASPPTAGHVEPSATNATAPSPAVASPSSDSRESPGWRPRRRPTR